jgi:hypothetical protein
MADTKVLFEILESAIVAAANAEVKTPDELLTLVLDIQAHDNLKTDECVAMLLIQGAVARTRSIRYSRATKDAKDRAAKLDRYNAAIAAHPEQALNPVSNATLMLSYGLMSVDQFAKLMESLKGAQSSVATHEVAVEKTA